MREPLFHWASQGITDWTPYSAAPIKVLRIFAAGGGIKDPNTPDYLKSGLPTDNDFRRRYAAILLRERGL
jgi:hypothetical protein